MKIHRVSATAVVKAPAEQVYAIIADYRNGHPHILPKQDFFDLEVDEGGIGAGTRIRFKMRAFGQIRSLRAVVTEPEPGRILVETDPDTGSVSTFTLVPKSEGQQVQVTITTETKIHEGLAGLLEGFLTSQLLKRIYVRELALVAAVAEERTQSSEVTAITQV